MPAMMCGADGGYLALTYRQINAILRCSGLPLQPPSQRKTQDKQRSLIARNRFEQIHHVAAGNPISSRLDMSVGNCTPGLEMDFRAVWRRIFEGVVLREYDNLVTEVEPGRPNVLATLPGKRGGTHLLFEAHLDTVSPSHGQVGPFAPPRLDDTVDLISGRGGHNESLAAGILISRDLGRRNRGRDVESRAV